MSGRVLCYINSLGVLGYINTVWEGTGLYKYCLGGYWVIQIMSGVTGLYKYCLEGYWAIQIMSGRVLGFKNNVSEGTGLYKYCLGG